MKTKLLEDKIKLLKSTGQYSAQRLWPAKGVLNTSSNKEEGERRQSEERESSQPTETNEVDTNLPNLPKQNQSGPLPKSHEQVAKDNPTRLLMKAPWTEVKYANKKQGAAKKGTQRHEPGGRRILFPREGAQTNSQRRILFNEALQKAEEPASVRFSKVKYSQLGAILALRTEKADATELPKTNIHKHTY